MEKQIVYKLIKKQVFQINDVEKYKIIQFEAKVNKLLMNLEI